MGYHVPALSIVSMAIIALVGVAIPGILLMVFRRKYKANVLAFFLGCAVFFVFAMVIEAILHRLILPSGIGLRIQGNTWLFAIYGGLMAGIFEETGRFTAFKILLRKKLGNDVNALMYGAGHGGFEAFCLLTITMVSYITIAVMLNTGMSAALTAGVTDEAARKALEATFATLAQTPPQLFLISIVERIPAVALHISLSVLVWFSVKDKGRFWLYPLAVLLHAVVDAVVVIMSRNGMNVWIIEVVLYVMSGCCIVIARKVWNKATADAKCQVPDL